MAEKPSLHEKDIAQTCAEQISDLKDQLQYYKQKCTYWERKCNNMQVYAEKHLEELQSNTSFISDFKKKTSYEGKSLENALFELIEEKNREHKTLLGRCRLNEKYIHTISQQNTRMQAAYRS